MSSLREIKDRISSVRSTLKITSAMKLVSSAKLRKSQAAIENMLPYQKTLQDIYSAALAAAPQNGTSVEQDEVPVANGRKAPVAVVAVSSNSSLCGGFNAAVLKSALSRIREEGDDVVVFPVGRKITDGLKKAGYVADKDYNDVIGHPAYESSAALADSLIDAFNDGRFSKVLLIYNHFVSTATQEVVVEQYLPQVEEKASGAVPAENVDDLFIMEPSPEEILESLGPQVLRLKIYTMVLDSAASEHAARTIAMQAATDNGEDILSELTLEYNKGRQQKITSEILDLLGGAQ